MGRERATRPTLAQKKLIESAGLKARDYHVLKETPDELHVVLKGNGKTRVIKKGEVGAKKMVPKRRGCRKGTEKRRTDF